MVTVTLILLPMIIVITSVSITECFLWSRSSSDTVSRQSLMDNWSSWSEGASESNYQSNEGYDSQDGCDCKCAKGQKKTVAIVIPKYKFVDIPVAKEIPSDKIKYTKSVKVQDESKYETFDEVDEHNHQLLDSISLR